MYSEVGSKYKRRVFKKTNYKKRFALLKVGLPRLVIRLSNLNVNLQYVEHNNKGDISKLNLLSKAIVKYGWTGNYKNLPAAYLTGYLFGKLVKKNNLTNKLIFDIGLHNAYLKGRLFATLKGAIDSGLDIAADESAFPNKDRIEGKHIKKEVLFKSVKEAIDKEFKV